jgi:hypothetical protein
LLEAGGEVHGNDARADASFLAGTASVASEVLVGGGASGGRAGITASVADITFVVGDEEVVVGGAELADTVAFGGGGVAAVGKAANLTSFLESGSVVDTIDVIGLHGSHTERVGAFTGNLDSACNVAPIRIGRHTTEDIRNNNAFNLFTRKDFDHGGKFEAAPLIDLGGSVGTDANVVAKQSSSGLRSSRSGEHSSNSGRSSGKSSSIRTRKDIRRKRRSCCCCSCCCCCCCCCCGSRSSCGGGLFGSCCGSCGSRGGNSDTTLPEFTGVEFLPGAEVFISLPSAILNPLAKAAEARVGIRVPFADAGKEALVEGPEVLIDFGLGGGGIKTIADFSEGDSLGSLGDFSLASPGIAALGALPVLEGIVVLPDTVVDEVLPVGLVVVVSPLAVGLFVATPKSDEVVTSFVVVGEGTAVLDVIVVIFSLLVLFIGDIGEDESGSQDDEHDGERIKSNHVEGLHFFFFLWKGKKKTKKGKKGKAQVVGNIYERSFRDF